MDQRGPDKPIVPEAGGIERAASAPPIRSSWWTWLGLFLLTLVAAVLGLTAAGTQVDRLLDTVGYGVLSTVTTGS